jgi:hypothetical protein
MASRRLQPRCRGTSPSSFSRAIRYSCGQPERENQVCWRLCWCDVSEGGEEDPCPYHLIGAETPQSAYDTLQSRYPSPSRANSSGPPDPRPVDPAELDPTKFLQGFPFAAPPSLPTFGELYAHMPHDDEVDVLVGCYYRHAAWNGTPVLRECFDEARRKLRERSTMPDHSLLNDSDFHRLALLYVVLAYGTLMNTERPPHHPLALVYCSLSQRCLAAGRFLVSNTLTALQAMVSRTGSCSTSTDRQGYHGKIHDVGAPSDVVIYTCPVSHRASYSSLDGGRDLAWQMWGLVARMMQAVSTRPG